MKSYTQLNASTLNHNYKIDINWGDHWLPTPISFYVRSPCRILSSDAQVADLIDPNTSWWNSRLLHEVFNDEEARFHRVLNNPEIYLFWDAPHMVSSQFIVHVTWTKNCRLCTKEGVPSTEKGTQFGMQFWVSKLHIWLKCLCEGHATISCLH